MAPTVPGSLVGKAAWHISKIRERRTGRRPGASRHLLTVAALGCGDAAAFLHGPTAGLTGLTLALVVLDYKIQD